MAGDLPYFDGDAFRLAIQSAMQMGAPQAEDQRATFFFPLQQTVVGPADASGVPYGPDAHVTRQPRRKVQVPVGIEYARGQSTQTSVGRFASDRVILTLLDVDYAKVAGDGTDAHPGFEFVVIGGVKYRYVKELVPRGLGPVTVHQIECAAEDER